MKRIAFILFGALLCATTMSAADETPADKGSSKKDDSAAKGEWAEDSNAKGVVIYSRIRTGTNVREFKGSGVIEAAPGAVFAVLNDAEAYSSFMPYVGECRVLKREKNVIIAYQRLEFPIISDRDYTIRSKSEQWIGPEGTIYRTRWEPVNNLGPAARPGITRVSLCEGGWLLEPDGANGTRATYSIFTDSGGSIPPMLANSGSRTAIRKIFEAVRKQVKDPKYAHGAAGDNSSR